MTNYGDNLKSTALARIYEMQGLKEDALHIYREVLLAHPENKEAQMAIKRLMLEAKRFPEVNKAQKQLFTQPQSNEDIIQFQRWLLQWNSKI